jgi:DNA-binding transcriptional regulator YbjK
VCDGELANLPWDANRLACLAELAEAATILGAVEHGAAVERALEPWAERNVGNARAVTFYGSAHHFLGKLAALRGDLHTATERLEAAIARNAAYGAGAREALSRLELERISSGVVQ